MAGRRDGRGPADLRPLELIPGWTDNPDGSCLVKWGRTWVLCTATLEARAPFWQKEREEGWVTAEYGMLPGSTDTRKRRPGPGRTDGRAAEIQRLVARSLRGACDLAAIPGWTVAVDCDVLQADGGTRVASVTGGFVALWLAAACLAEAGALPSRDTFVRRRVAAVSAAWLDGQPVLDPDYLEDKGAAVDLNLVGTFEGDWVECQATGEDSPVPKSTLDALLEVAFPGLAEVAEAVAAVL